MNSTWCFSRRYICVTRVNWPSDLKRFSGVNVISVLFMNILKSTFREVVPFKTTSKVLAVRKLNKSFLDVFSKMKHLN